MNAESAFGKVSLKAFVDHKSGLLFYDLGSDLKEDVPVEISVERFGSRTFSHWYSQINRDASIGLSGTEAVADSQRDLYYPETDIRNICCWGKGDSEKWIKG